jgi:hypothetical protein
MLRSLSDNSTHFPSDIGKIICEENSDVNN